MTKMPENRFSSFAKTHADNLAHEFGTPLFILDEIGIVARFCEIQASARLRYPFSMIAVSYKTNLLQGLMALLHREGAHAEVVSGMEYTVAKKLQQPAQRIVFNGPMKTTEELIIAIKDGAIINCDHEDEIANIEQIARSLNCQVAIGLRIYFKSRSAWNRFGFLADVQLTHTSIIKRILHSPYLKLAGVHTHIGTNIRDFSYFENLGNDLHQFVCALRDKFQIELEWIDVGGGLAGISPRIDENRLTAHALPNINTYMDAIIKPLLPYLHSLAKPATLIFEPGRTLFEAYGALLTKVIGRRHADSEELPDIILDAGYNTLATSHIYDFPVRVFSTAEPFSRMRLYGPSCNQIDQLHMPMLLPALKLNDLIMFYGVGSYCMAFSYSFIRFRPGVVLWNVTGAKWLRKPETLERNAMLGEESELIQHEACA